MREEVSTFSPLRERATRRVWSQRVVDLVSLLSRTAPPISSSVFTTNPRARPHPFEPEPEPEPVPIYSNSLSIHPDNTIPLLSLPKQRWSGVNFTKLKTMKIGIRKANRCFDGSRDFPCKRRRKLPSKSQLMFVAIRNGMFRALYKTKNVIPNNPQSGVEVFSNFATSSLDHFFLIKFSFPFVGFKCLLTVNSLI